MGSQPPIYNSPLHVAKVCNKLKKEVEELTAERLSKEAKAEKDGEQL